MHFDILNSADLLHSQTAVLHTGGKIIFGEEKHSRGTLIKPPTQVYSLQTVFGAPQRLMTRYSVHK